MSSKLSPEAGADPLDRLAARAESLARPHPVAAALERLAGLRAEGWLDDEELALAKRRVLDPEPVADVRALGPGRRGRTLAVAFDEVLTAAPAGTDALVIDHPPRAGAIDWLERAVERFDVAIVSRRTGAPGGVDVMRAWLREHGLSPHAEARIRFPRHKPPADAYLAPRLWRFEGRFPTAAEIEAETAGAQGSRG